MGEESFRPRAQVAPEGFVASVKFFLRTLGDFQLLTITRDVRRFLSTGMGKVLDVGCGNCPFEPTARRAGLEYVGIDVTDAKKWDYNNSRIIHFDGQTIPFEDATFDHLICTEVIEHVEDPRKLIAEMHRVLKSGGTGLITLPWSARFHYKPHDYHRYTPTMLSILFGAFQTVHVSPRGTDITSVANKLIVMYAGALTGLFRSARAFPARLLGLILGAIPLAVVVGWAHVSLWAGWGSEDDPSGYTVYLSR